MIEQSFIIKSLYVQNGLMLTILGIITFLFFRSLWKRQLRFVVVCCLWSILIFWFFNSQFWGFSALGIGNQKIHLQYGFLSIFKNQCLSLNASAKIKSSFAGFPQYKRLYYLVINDCKSMGVEEENKEKLEEIYYWLEKKR